jgi:hypothetical protein
MVGAQKYPFFSLRRKIPAKMSGFFVFEPKACHFLAKISGFEIQKPTSEPQR